MDEELKKLQCELCGTEHFLLIQVEVASESWGGRKGVCSQCFKNGNIEERIFLKHKSFIEQQIESIESRKQFWTKELNSLNP